MVIFFKQLVVTLASLILFSGLWGGYCFYRYNIKSGLLPSESSSFPWVFLGLTDTLNGGSSAISMKDSSQYIDYSYVLTDDVKYPFVTAMIVFSDSGENYINLSRYTSLTIRIKCSTENILAFNLHSYDAKVTEKSNLDSYRISEFWFSCSPEWQDVAIDLHHLHVPAWWLDLFNQKNSDQAYQLEKVHAISFAASRQGPIDTLAQVSINKIGLEGVDQRFLWLYLVTTVLFWLLGIGWLVKRYTVALIQIVENKAVINRPIVAHEHLSNEPRAVNTQVGQILDFMAVEYCNSDMSLEFVTTQLGINRNTLNKLLKSELGLTFNAYLNKLRLVEAARILSKNEETSVSELAYSLGYNNVTYFNRLFKQLHGCTPKQMKTTAEAEPIQQ